MKTVAKLMAVLAVVGLVALAQAADKPKKPAGVRGKVVKVDGAKITIQAKDGEKTVETDANTKFTVDGKDGKITDLKEGMFLNAVPETGVATEVKAMTPKPKNK